MEMLMDLGVFSGKVIVLLFAVSALLILLFVLIAKARQQKPLLSVENLNLKYQNMSLALKEGVFEDKEFKAELKAQKKLEKERKSLAADQKRIFVIDFHGDIRAGQLDNLREEVTSILTVARPDKDEVVVRVESPGGMVHAYGLAAAQLVRLRDSGLQLTVCVDKIAASGGYMMACTAHKIIAAPFAILGSIGVVAQVPNVHRLLKKHDVDFEEITAGEFKRTVSFFGEITDRGRQKFLEQIEDTHGLFKAFVKTYRPQLNLEAVATGEYWFGQRARELQLADEIMASDDYLFKQRETAKIFKVEILARKKWSEKLAENMARVVLGTIDKSFAGLNQPFES